MMGERKGVAKKQSSVFKWAVILAVIVLVAGIALLNGRLTGNPVSSESSVAVGWSFSQDFSSDLQSYEASAYTPTVTAVGNPILVQDGIGKSVSFNGEGDYLKIPAISVPLSSPSTLTVMGWFKTAAFKSGANEITGSWVSDRDSFVFVPWTDKSVSFYVSIAGNWYAVSTPFENPATNIALNTWEHWVGTYDGATLKLYKNGVLVSQRSLSGTVGKTGDLCLGADCTIPNRFFKGKMDEVRVYTRALSANEINTLYTQQKNSLLDISSVGQVIVSVSDQRRGKDVGDAQVTLKSGTKTFTGTYDGEGHYLLSDVSVGQYALTASAAGYTTYTSASPLNVVAGANPLVSIELASASAVIAGAVTQLNSGACPGAITVVGKYEITAPISFDATSSPVCINITVPNTQIICKAGITLAKAGSVAPVGITTNQTGIVLTGCNIQLNDQGIGMLFVKNSGVSVNGGKIDHVAQGISSQQGISLSVLDTVVQNSADDGIFADKTRTVNLDTVQALSNKNRGVMLKDADTAYVIFSTLQNNNDGIFIQNVLSYYLANNTIVRNTRNGAIITDSLGSPILSNNISYNGAKGLMLTRSNSSQIYSNELRRNGEKDIVFVSSSNNILFNNLLSAGSSVSISNDAASLSNTVYGENNALTPPVVNQNAGGTVGGGGGGGGGNGDSNGNGGALRTLTAAEFTAGKQIKARVGDLTRFKVGDTYDTAELRAVTDTQATFLVTSLPQIVTLSKGESKKVDVNGDGILDVLLTLDNVNRPLQQAEFTLKLIKEAVASSVNPGKNPVVEGSGSGSNLVPPKPGTLSPTVIVVGVLLALAILAGLAKIFLSKRKAEEE